MNVRNLLFTSLAFTCFTLGSCVPEKDLHEEKPVTYSEVSFSIGGECVVTEKPMNRAGEGSKDLYGINVAMLVKNANDDNFSPKPYAYGIFSKEAVKSLKINLIDGYAYRVSCTMVIDGKDSLAQENGFVRPFTLDRNRTAYGTITDKFITSERPDGSQLYLHDLDAAQIGTTGQANIQRPFIKRYHGTIDTQIIAPGTTNQNELEVYRRYFGVQIKTPKLQAKFKMKVQIDDSPAIWLSSTQTESAITYVTMKNLTAKVEPSKIVTDNGRLIATVYEEGKEAKQILNYAISFKRNYLHIVSITDIDHNGTPGGITVKVEDTKELEFDDEIDLPWQGGN